MTEIIEGTARDVTPQSAGGSAVVVHDAPRAVQTFDAPTQDPLRALGRMDMAEFESEVKALVLGKQRMQQLQRDLLRKGIDYDTIPGTDKDTLLQPGAEQLCMFHRLIPEHLQTITVTPIPGHADRIDVDTTTHLHLGSLDGPIVGTAKASASSYEDRYRWRNSERVCPKCGKPAIYKSKAEWAPKANNRPLPGYEGGGWKCGTKKGGCGANFPDAEPSLANAAPGKVENDEPHSLRNTIIQMSAKRGLVGATRHTLGITDLFTQDVEDMAPQDGPGASEAPPPDDQPRASAPAAARPAAAAPAASNASGKKGQRAVYEGKLVAVPDGTRSGPDGVTLRFKMKVGASNHHVNIEGPMSTAVYKALEAAGVDAHVKVDGTRYMEKWEGQGDKPDMKIIREVTDVDVAGQHIAGPGPAAPQPVQQAFDDGPPPFEDGDVATQPAQRAAWAGDPNGTADVTGVLATIESKATPTGTAYYALELDDPENPGRYWKIAVGEVDQVPTDDFDAPLWSTGQPLRAIGGWNAKGAVLVAAMVMDANTVPA